MIAQAKSSKTMVTLTYSQETGRVIPLDEIDAKPASSTKAPAVSLQAASRWNFAHYPIDFEEEFSPISTA